MWSTCEAVLTPYGDVEVVVTVVRVRLFVLYLRECEGDGYVDIKKQRKHGCGECMACGWYTWFRYCDWRS